MKATLPCPHCHGAIGVHEVIEGATASVPAQRLLVLGCPRCGAALWAQVYSGHLAVGRPAESWDEFRPSASAAAPGLAVRAEPGALECTVGAWLLRVPAA